MVQEYTNYTVNMPKQAAWLVYLNGVEVPVMGLTASFGVWQIPTATIQLVPHVLLQRIGYEDRIQVQIFYLDEYYDASNPEFKLLGEFEVVGWSYTNSGASRAMELHCEALPRVFKQLFMYYMSAIDDVVVAGLPATGTNANVISDTMVYYPASLFLHGLIRPHTKSSGDRGTAITDEGADFIKSPFEFISNLFVGLLGPIDNEQEDPSTADPGKLPLNAASAPGRNFFARWFQMTDFVRRWGGLPGIDDDDAKKEKGCFPLLRATQSTDVMRAIQVQIGQSVGHSGSIWDIFKMVYETMQMEIAMIPAPAVVRLKKGSMLLSDKQGPLRGKNGNLLRDSGKDYTALMQNFVKPRCIFGIPPRCNMIFPSMVNQYAFTETYSEQPTRVYLGERELSRYIAAQAEGSVQKLVSETLTTGYPPVVKQRMKDYILDPKQNTKNFLIYPEELYKGPVTRQINAPPWLFQLEKMSEASRWGANYDPTVLPAIGGREGGDQYVANVRSIIDPIIEKYAKPAGVPVALVHATIYKESGYRMHIVDGIGAAGLMQIQPAFVKDGKKRSGSMRSTWEGLKTGIPFEEMNPLDPENNIRMGVQILKNVLHVKHGKEKKTLWNVTSANKKDLAPDDLKITDLELVVWAYNGGVGHAKTLYFAREENHVAAYKKYDNYRKPVRRTLEAWDKYEALTEKINKKEVIADRKYSINRPAKDAPIAEDTKATIDQNKTTDSLNVELNEPLGQLFDMYAKYEMYRLRYEQRTGGVNMIFNPYVVPGFPAIVFDEMTTGMHTMGYVMNVTHTFSAAPGSATMSTSVGMAFMRTVPEFISAMKLGMEEHADTGNKRNPTDIAPREPIPAVANLFQYNGAANNFYKALFYPEHRHKGGFEHQWIFDWKKMLTIRTFEGKTLDLLTLDLPVKEGDTAAEDDVASTVNPETWKYGDGLVAFPRKKLREAVRAADKGMHYVARPVCTLRDFIELRHGKAISSLVYNKKSNTKPTLLGKDKSFYSSYKSKGSSNTGGAAFWGRIDYLLQGPGNLSDDILQKITNVVYDGKGYPTPPAGTWDTITSKHLVPQTRLNWDAALQKYRKIVRGESPPQD